MADKVSPPPAAHSVRWWTAKIRNTIHGPQGGYLQAPAMLIQAAGKHLPGSFSFPNHSHGTINPPQLHSKPACFHPRGTVILSATTCEFMCYIAWLRAAAPAPQAGCKTPVYKHQHWPLKLSSSITSQSTSNCGYQLVPPISQRVHSLFSQPLYTEHRTRAHEDTIPAHVLQDCHGGPDTVTSCNDSC